MFSYLGLFKKTPCPEHPHCSLNHCLFAHDHPPESKDSDTPTRKSPLADSLEPEDTINGSDGPRKRRRISAEVSNGIGSSRNTVSPALGTPEREASVLQKNAPEDALPRTASKRISPPPRRNTKVFSTKRVERAEQWAARSESDHPSTPKKVAAQITRLVEESLNPRMLPNPPVSHPIRMKLVTMLHKEMTRLNGEVKSSLTGSKDVFVLTDQELIREALDEEFQVAMKSPTVYQNVIKSRIMVLKKMKLEVWKEERIKKMAQKQPAVGLQKPSTPKTIETGLTPAEEVSFVSRLAAHQEGLSKHGYVTSMPTSTELEAAKRGLESSQGWELCDRCKTRFQVFPGRRAEDGALTSGGKCTYHWAKPRRPDMVKGDNKPRDLKYACCDELVGVSAGCTIAEFHVFKISDPKRLALVMPFKATPSPNRPGLPGAVCFDCEMGYTTSGMELIRLTATAWPDGGELLDVLVRPIGEILDLNSRFSGVWPDDFAKALPHNQDMPQAEDDHSVLQIVESPSKARELLFGLLTPETPLIGHALENDLNATRILHPVIIDTCLVYAHPRGLPLRYGLKFLMKKHLDQDIQMGGDQGHDSKEDARAAGDLVRLRVSKMWEQMKIEGWTMRNGIFCPPLPLTAPPDGKQTLPEQR
ncbi:MAG: hypothetical protein L6R39_002198 [Caloplaca ligustica]|nr:MAG: hypothetical protein L6R39_002198 [Caloplaca ligustica]